jgi:hypothetical protein
MSCGDHEADPLSSRPKRHSLELARDRSLFLRMALELPDSRRRLFELFDAATVNLAERDLYRQSEVSPSLHRRIEDWAVRCRLADAPVDRSWLFRNAVALLKWHCFGPTSLDGGEDDIDALVGVTVDFSRPRGEPERIEYSFRAWMPPAESHREYIQRQQKSFRAFLNREVKRTRAAWQEAGFLRVPQSQYPTHYRWLVRYQILGESYETIAKSENKTPRTVKVKVSELRRIIGLPQARRAGRPRK